MIPLFKTYVAAYNFVIHHGNRPGVLRAGETVEDAADRLFAAGSDAYRAAR